VQLLGIVTGDRRMKASRTRSKHERRTPEGRTAEANA
jgi:hypothetical protein